MSTYVAFPTTERFLSKYKELGHKLSTSVEEAQAPLACEVSSEMADLATQALIFRLLEITEADRPGASLLRQYGQMINKTTRYMTNKFLATLPDSEIQKLLYHLETNMHVSEERTFATFPISDEFAQEFVDSIQNLDSEEFQKSMVKTMELALDHYLLRPLSLLDIGDIARKLGETSVGALKMALSISYKQILSPAEDHQLKLYCDYARSWLIEIEPAHET